MRFLHAFWACVGAYALAFLVTLGWYHGSELIYFWDQTFPIDVGRGIATISHLVRNDFWPGEIDPPSGAMLPYFVLLWLASLGGRALALGQHALFAGLLAAPALGMYLFTGLLFERLGVREGPRTIARAAASFGYACNPFALTNLWRIFSTHTFAYAAHPFLAYCALAYIARPKARYLLAAALLMLLAAPGYSNVAAYAAVLAAFFFPLFLSALSPQEHPPMEARARMERALRYAGVVAAFSLWFVLPLLMNVAVVREQGSFGGTSEALLGNTEHASLYGSLRLVGGSATYETYIDGDPDYPWAANYNAPPHPEWLATNLFVLLALAGAIFALRRRRLRYALGGFLAATLLSTGPRNPFTGALYMACFNAVESFHAFRDPFDKFGLPLAFWEFTFIALGTYALLERLSRPWRAAAAAAIFLGFAVAGWPLLTGAVQRAPSTRPESTLSFPGNFGALAREVETHWPTLVLPLSPGPLVAQRWPRGYVGFDPLRFATYVPILSTDPSDPDARRVLHVAQNELASGLRTAQAIRTVRSLGFRSVLVRTNANALFTPAAPTAPRIARSLRWLGIPQRDQLFELSGSAPSTLASVGATATGSNRLSVLSASADEVEVLLAPAKRSHVVLTNTCFACGWRLRVGSADLPPDLRLAYHAPAWAIPKHDKPLRVRFENVEERKTERVRTACAALMALLLVGLSLCALREREGA